MKDKAAVQVSKMIREKMKMTSQKGFSAILIVVIVVIVLAVSFFLFNKQGPKDYDTMTNYSTPSSVSEDKDIDSVNIDDLDKELSELDKDSSDL